MSKMPKNDYEIQKHSAKRLWRLLYAKEHIQQAADAIKMCLHELITEKHPYYKIVTTTAIVSYSAPFVSAGILGKLESRFEKFDTEKQKTFHLGIVEGRNTYYCHTDPHKLQPLKIHIERRRNMSDHHYEYSSSYYKKWINSKNLPEFLELCELQLNRIDDVVSGLMPYVIPMKHGYVLMGAKNADKIIVDVPYPED